jgi:hypothetical protein
VLVESHQKHTRTTRRWVEVVLGLDCSIQGLAQVVPDVTANQEQPGFHTGKPKMRPAGGLHLSRSKPLG